MAKAKKRADGRYQQSISIGRDENGKLIRKVVYGTTRAELEQKVTELKLSLNSGKFVKNGDTMLIDYARAWLSTYKVNKGINTQAMYENIIEKHIEPSLGHYTLSEIRRSDIQQTISERSDKYRTCEQYRITLKQILDCAVEDGIIASNPCTRIELPTKPRSTKRALNDLEKQAISTAAFADMDKAFVWLIYFFGMRREEALAIMPADFDFKAMLLHVHKAIVFDGNTPVLSVTKNATSDRYINIPEQAVPFFKTYIANLKSMYLIHKENGELLTQSAYTKMWRRILKCMNEAVITEAEKKMNIKPISGLTAHIFRHNYATMLYYSGISIKKAAQLMGHANTKMIMEIYAHLDDEKENVSEKINNVISL